MKIAVVILCDNSAKYIPNCLESLRKLFLGETEVEIIVVDNASSDQTADLVSKKYPSVTLISNLNNLGFAEGNNVGIRYALNQNAQYIWLINPDVTVDRNSLSGLLESTSKYRQAGIFSSKIYFTPGTENTSDKYSKKDIGHIIWYAGGNMDWGDLSTTNRGLGQVDENQFNDDTETDYIPAVSMFIRSRVFAEVGLIDSKYFLYFEENDFCQRAKAAGWQLMYIPDSIAWHANAPATGVGSSLQDYYITRNRLLFGMRHAPTFTKLHLIKQSIQLYLGGRPWQKRAILDYYTGNFGPGSFQP